jgi:hypothetical protein
MNSLAFPPLKRDRQRGNDPLDVARRNDRERLVGQITSAENQALLVIAHLRGDRGGDLAARVAIPRLQSADVAVIHPDAVSQETLRHPGDSPLKPERSLKHRHAPPPVRIS